MKLEKLWEKKVQIGAIMMAASFGLDALRYLFGGVLVCLSEFVEICSILLLMMGAIAFILDAIYSEKNQSRIWLQWF